MPVAVLTFLVVLGLVGLFLVLPRGRLDRARRGWLLLAAAGGLLAAMLFRLTDTAVAPGWFWGLALVALVAALRVITHRRPVYSALYFVLLIVAIAGLLVLMQAEFLAAVLVVVYAGAILVTYLFVIMLAQRPKPAGYDLRAREPLWGCLAGFFLLGLIAGQICAPSDRPPEDALAVASGTVQAVGTALLTEYIVGVEIAGVLLLAALVGAIAIASRRPGTETDG